MKTILKIGTIVFTKFGLGTVIESEYREPEVYIVKLDDPPIDFKYLQDKFGGINFKIDELYVFENRLKMTGSY